MSRVVVIALCTSLACEKAPVAPPGTGGLALSIEIEAGSSRARVDDGMVHVRGPTTWDVSIAPGETKTITELAPGSYTVSLEGLTSGEVELFDRSHLASDRRPSRGASQCGVRPAPSGHPGAAT